jgi:GWxTD domain-containing protein
MLDRRRIVSVFVLVLLALAVPRTARCAGAGPAPRRAAEARRLVERAVQRLALRTIEGRREAIADLERATSIDPQQPDYQLMLARAYYSAGFLRAATRRFARVVALDPADAGAHYGLGQSWRRDWLHYLDTTSLVRAVDHVEAAASLDSTYTDAWLTLASLRLERHEPGVAAEAAAHAVASDPGRAECTLVLAAARWRLGDVEGAVRGFRDAVPRMPGAVRRRFEDIAPLATEADTTIYNHLPAPARAEFARRFWLEHDPDLTTPENEAQLEYWARVTQAYFLFYDAKHREWDERGELYVRYGPPEKADYNPLTATLYSRVSSTDMLAYPMNVMEWSWPKFGMSVALQDRVLSEYYQLPTATDHDPDPRPDPDSLAHLGVIGTHDFRGVFPVLPPASVPVRIEPALARFEGADGPRLLAMLEAASTPGDSLVAQAVVFDSTGREVARGTQRLAPSACEADRYRVADFTHGLPPGSYTVGFSVRAGARRGSARMPVELPERGTALALSDLVVTCGTPAAPGAAVRLDPNPLARVPAGAPLTAYFEVYHLTPGSDGQSRFEYEYRVKSADRDPRIWIQRALSPRPAIPELEASRAEANTGSMRRQFVSVPVQSMPPGRFRLEIVVRDLQTGQEATRSAVFTHLAP